jgi:hypothetical protein
MIPRFLMWGLARLIRRPVLRHINAFEEATHRPREVQEALLRRILTAQTPTDYGRDHGFAHMSTPEDFRRQVPVAGYEYIEPYLARVRRGELKALLADAKIHMFAMTSGTTAGRKYIPVTDQYLSDYRRGWNIWGLRAYREHQSTRLRPIVQMSSDWCEFRTESGTPCGSVTGLTAEMQKRIIRWLYCVPGCVSRIKDTPSKYYTVLRLSMPRPVGLVIAANPSTLVNLARAGDRDKEALLRDIHDGTLSTRFDIAPEIRAALRGRLKPQRERARELEALANRTGTLYPKDYWPSDSCLLGNWTGGSVGAYLRHFPTYFGDTPIRDVGLIASEGRMTIPISDHTPSGVLDITSHYFEFIPEEEGDNPNPTTFAAHELKEGGKYFILLTTAYGLYRYHIYDLVRVTGFYNGTPLIEFLSKGAHFANLTGEKLSEYHVTRSMQDVLGRLDLNLTAYTVSPCWDDLTPYYGVFVERGDFQRPEQGQALVEALEQRLCEMNSEYACKRETLRLKPVRLELLPTGTWAQWDRQRLARNGGTLEQYKHPCLVADPNFRDTLQKAQESLGTPAQSTLSPGKAG